ncbi:hypothetical protein OGAPHI_006879 [Ogataea philodendri]|uniref:Phytase-like domain-containing protein n=1 Tax=Ogataea philodendri TaxID=1378263 RepID=A0A9P8NTX6_9ASCO|nr:uncharacterized protein OGAPHI_006879 [Ogataea philodendri]KAH3660293.1 hypothetical protein OGAPHI_006879 [Ogataea philodendri]
MKFSISLVACLSLISAALAADSVYVGNDEYVNFGLVGYGFAPGDSVDKYKDTISFGSSVALQEPSLSVSNGVYSFVTYNLPDRGWNTNGTLNFVPRIHKYGAKFTPLNSSSSQNLVWDYQDTILLKDFNGDFMTGLDCNTTLEQNGYTLPASAFVGNGFGADLDSGKTTTYVCLDPEALRLVEGDINNGFWITDEYGPGLYKFDSNGTLIDFTLPPDAIVPYRNNEQSFNADSPPIYETYDTGDPDSGRANNQGFEGAALSPDGKYLFALLQSAAMQEGGNKKYTSSNARMVKYDVSGSTPTLVGEYVFQLPTYNDPDYSDDKNPRTAAQSEIVYVTDEIFLVLARDSNHGRGQSNTASIYRHADIYSIANATNVAGKYDGEGDKIASKKGNLDSDITPAKYYSFLNYNNETELQKFGLHNGGEDDYTLLNEKWEGITLVPVQCTTDEYFLLTVSDDDFITQNGFMNFGQFPYKDSSGFNLDNQALVFHVKLPGLTHDKVCPSSSAVPSASSSKASSAVPSSSSFKASSAAPSATSSAKSSGTSSSSAKSTTAPTFSTVVSRSSLGYSNSSSTGATTGTGSTDATLTTLPSGASTEVRTTVIDGTTITETCPCSKITGSTSAPGSGSSSTEFAVSTASDIAATLKASVVGLLPLFVALL